MNSMTVARISVFVPLIFVFVVPQILVAAPTEQLPIGRVELMPNNPEPF